MQGQPPIHRSGGRAGDIPVPGDYDGDGTTDIAVFRPHGQLVRQGRSRPIRSGAVERGRPRPRRLRRRRHDRHRRLPPSTGTGTSRASRPIPQWGGRAGDIPVPGDYDGNGTTDIAVYRPTRALVRQGPAALSRSGGVSGRHPRPRRLRRRRHDRHRHLPARRGRWYVKDQPPFVQWGGQTGDVPVPGDYDGDGTTDIAVFRQSDGRWWIAPPADPVVAAAGDLCSTASDCAPSAAVVDAIDPARVLVLGDNAYPNGSPSDYASFYQPNWGRFKAKTRPVPGNHEYQTAGAAGYFGYFTGVQPYYSFDVGAWHLIALNSELPVSVGSAQETWLKADLAANAGKCILAYWHQPRWSSGQHGSNSTYHQLWVDLYAAGADIVLNGHDHNYERFAKQNASGVAKADGVREFVVGTGGRALRAVRSDSRQQPGAQREHIRRPRADVARRELRLAIRPDRRSDVHRFGLRFMLTAAEARVEAHPYHASDLGNGSASGRNCLNLVLSQLS